MNKEGINFEKLHDTHYDKDKESSLSYERMERKQLKLKLLKKTLEDRETFLKLRRDILEKIKAAGVAPEKIARDEKTIKEAEESIAVLKQREHELEVEIAEHFDDYQWEGEVLNEPSPSEHDN